MIKRKITAWRIGKEAKNDIIRNRLCTELNGHSSNVKKCCPHSISRHEKLLSAAPGQIINKNSFYVRELKKWEVKKWDERRVGDDWQPDEISFYFSAEMRNEQEENLIEHLSAICDVHWGSEWYLIKKRRKCCHILKVKILHWRR